MYNRRKYVLFESVHSEEKMSGEDGVRGIIMSLAVPRTFVQATADMLGFLLSPIACLKTRTSFKDRACLEICIH